VLRTMLLSLMPSKSPEIVLPARVRRSAPTLAEARSKSARIARQAGIETSIGYPRRLGDPPGGIGGDILKQRAVAARKSAHSPLRSTSGRRRLRLRWRLGLLAEVALDELPVARRHIPGQFHHGLRTFFFGQLAPGFGELLESLLVHFARAAV